MNLTKGHWVKMFGNICDLLIENAEKLSKMDAVTGDGDHGVTMQKIVRVIKQGIDEWSDNISLKELFEKLSSQIMNVNGGSAGSLWGTLFAGFANGLDSNEVDEKGIIKMFAAGLQEVQDISSAKVGDKTLMDALIPAVKAVQCSNEDLPVLLHIASEAAKQGATNTANYMAKFGRAKNLKEKSIGYKDPGAVSMSLLFEGMALSFK